jgi:hypothetical protein
MNTVWPMRLPCSGSKRKATRPSQTRAAALGGGPLGPAPLMVRDDMPRRLGGSLTLMIGSLQAIARRRAGTPAVMTGERPRAESSRMHAIAQQSSHAIEDSQWTISALLDDATRCPVRRGSQWKEQAMAIERLNRHEIFRHLRPEQVNLLSESAEVVKYKAGQLVYARGGNATHCFIVLKGHIGLRLPGKGSVSVLIDELTEGDMFGGCVSATLDSYALNARCMEDSDVLVISAAAMKAVMDEDPRMGYLIQSRISEIYFRRYVETMEKLQAIVMNIPVATT